MMWKERLTLPRIIAIVLLSLVPFAMIILGLHGLFCGLFITPASLLGFFVWPCATIAGYYFLITSKKDLFDKIVVSILLLVGFVIIDLATLLWGPLKKLEHYKDASVAEAYEARGPLFEIMPDLKETGTPQKTESYRYVWSGYILLMWETNTLICEYSEAEYEIEKARLEERYVFQTEPMQNDFPPSDSPDEQFCESTAEIDDYIFRTLCVDGEYKDETRYPDQLMFVGTNDTTREIVYLATDDPERDYIESLDEYILEICGWKYIR